MNDDILLIIAHPDDEILGMGGTLQKLILDGKKINILLLSRPGNARKDEDPNVRLDNFKEIIKKIGVSKVYYEDFPDIGFDSVNLLDIIQKIEKVISIIKPKNVYTHFYNDLNIDHSITSRATLTALRPIEKFNFVKNIFLFEVISTTELSIGSDKFNPNYYVDIEEFIDLKKQLCSIYKTEIQKSPNPRTLESIETLAKYRGIESGLKYAEAFFLYRAIN